MIINQVASGLEYGDGVSFDILNMQKALIELGYESNIILKYIDKRLPNKYIKLEDYHGDKDAILIIHHSLLLQDFEKILALPDRKFLRYHNITPPNFFKFNKEKVDIIYAGAKQLEVLKDVVEYTLADSLYNELELRKMGFMNVQELPIVKEFSAIPKKAMTARLEFIREYIQQQPHNILTVGRIVENKGQLELVQTIGTMMLDGKLPDTRLFLVGSSDQNTKYASRIKDYITANNLGERIIVTGKILEEEKIIFFENCDLYISNSSHEGFCIPINEAMLLNKLVIARNSTAIPYTLGDNGLFYDSITDLPKLLTKAYSNEGFRLAALKSQALQVEKLSYKTVKQKLGPLLEKAIAKERRIILKMPEVPETLKLLEDENFDIYLSHNIGSLSQAKLQAGFRYLYTKSQLNVVADLEIMISDVNIKPELTARYNVLFLKGYKAKQELQTNNLRQWDALLVDDKELLGKLEKAFPNKPVLMVDNEFTSSFLEDLYTKIDKQIKRIRVGIIIPGVGIPLVLKDKIISIDTNPELFVFNESEKLVADYKNASDNIIANNIDSVYFYIDGTNLGSNALKLVTSLIHRSKKVNIILENVSSIWKNAYSIISQFRELLDQSNSDIYVLNDADQKYLQQFLENSKIKLLK